MVDKCQLCEQSDNPTMVFMDNRACITLCDDCQGKITRTFLATYGIDLDNIMMDVDLSDMADEEYNKWINDVESKHVESD